MTDTKLREAAEAVLALLETEDLGRGEGGCDVPEAAALRAALDAAPEADAEPRETEGDALDAAAAMFYGPMTNGTIADELLAWRAAGVAAGERTAPEADAFDPRSIEVTANDRAAAKTPAAVIMAAARVDALDEVAVSEIIAVACSASRRRSPARRSPEEIAREVCGCIRCRCYPRRDHVVFEPGACDCWRDRIAAAIRADRGE